MPHNLALSNKIINGLIEGRIVSDEDGIVYIELPEETPKHEFKPFDKVLVREDDLTSWQAAFFSHIESFEDGERFAITTSGDNYNLANNEIIPYKGNEHFVGTTVNPE